MEIKFHQFIFGFLGLFLFFSMNIISYKNHKRTKTNPFLGMLGFSKKHIATFNKKEALQMALCAAGVMTCSILAINPDLDLVKLDHLLGIFLFFLLGTYYLWSP